jgi:GT2 family glycosyltransferase/tetratricopeptide (TPR) repeat protein
VSAPRRPPATIVILAWNAWEETRACLESLRPTLGVRDQVVVVDNGSTDATATQLPRYPWVEVISNAENRGFAGGCNQGAAAARHDLLVFLNNDTVLSGKWLDSLLAPFEDERVGATGPRSNFVSGPQIAEGASYLPGDTAAMRRFARDWSQANRGRTTDTDRLVGFCLAVRRQAFVQVGGFDEGYAIGGYEDDDLCRRLLHEGWRLLIAHESFVHHDGHATFDANGVDWIAQEHENRGRFVAKFGGGDTSHDFPLVSACLIVKDEEENLAACLGSLEGFADEVVVYDTGSSDATVSLARSLGATVIEGYWDDDFSRARNAALEHCRGQWIAWLDADETLVCDDVAALREQLLRTSPGVDGYSVPIENLTGSGAGSLFVHSACRLFRRAVCEWTGRLHEQVAGRGDHRGIVQAPMERARLRHTGYLDSVMAARGKHERNIRLAAAEVDGGESWDQGYSLTNLGRSYLTAGHFEEALEHCRRGAELTANPMTRRLALRSCAEACLGLQRPEEALDFVAQMRAAGATSAPADIIGGKALLAAGDPAGALAAFERVGPTQIDEDGFEYRAHDIALVRAQALADLGRPGDAADVLLSALGEAGTLDTHLGKLVELLDLAGRPLDDLATAIPTAQATLFLAQVLQLRDDAADRVLDACLHGFAQPLPVLATAATLARRLPVERALVWSARLRQQGLASACPLLAVARATGTPVERARAAATAVAAFGDGEARTAFAAALDAASAAERGVIVTEAQVLCPDLLAAAGAPAAAAAPVAGPVATPPTAAAPGPTSSPARRSARLLIGAPSGTAGSPPAPTTGALGAAASSAPAGPAPSAGPVRVSIVIPCFNEAEHTLRCLQSLQATPSAVATEIILVDNGSTDATRQLAGMADERFRVIRNEDNRGFGPACNQGAAAARGEYVLFLNNDTVVRPGWLEPLVADLDEDPRLGAVQPKLLYPDGRLNDAGGLVFADGEAWVYGKGGDPDAPPYDCRRAPDYASGACLLVRRSAFEEVGGFDDRYAPAYYEDTDLSFALRAAGYTVLYEPASSIVHVEGGTAGTDVGVGLKQYQVRNAERFKEKWRDELAWRPRLDPAVVDRWAHRPQGGFGPGELAPTPEARDWAVARRRAADAKSVLVIDPFMPAFDRASGSLRLFTLLRCLREAGHAVTYFPFTGGDRRYAREVGKFGVVCYGGDPARYELGSEYCTTHWPPLDRLLTSRHFDVLLLTPWTSAELLLPGVRQFLPDALMVLDTNDVHFVRLERQAELSGDPALAAEARETRRRELATYRLADRIVCVTEEDADVVRRHVPGADVLVLPNAHGELDPGPGFAERAGCTFVGNFNHPPNGDAVAWWKAEIGPALASLLPEVELTVVGNDPQGVAAAMAGPGVKVAGTVPSTLPYLHAARVSVAPLRFGAGMKGKVGEALAAGLPVVATSTAVEGMGVVDGEHVLVADTPAEFAEAVARLHSDEALWERLRVAGRKHVREHFGVDRMRRGVAELLAPATRAVTPHNRQQRRAKAGAGRR